MDVEEDSYQAGESSHDAAEFDNDANDAMEAPNQSAKRRFVSTATAKEPVAAAGGAEPMDVEGEDDDEMRVCHPCPHITCANLRSCLISVVWSTACLIFDTPCRKRHNNGGHGSLNKFI